MTRTSTRAIGRALQVLGVVVASATPLAAQRASDLEPGARIRADVHTTEVSRLRRIHDQPLTGTFAGMAGDTLLLAVRPGLQPIRVPESAIRELHVSQGRRGRVASALRSAWLPALLGGTLGATLASLRGARDGESPARAAARRAATAALFAGAMGAAFPTERWHRLWRREAQR